MTHTNHFSSTGIESSPCLQLPVSGDSAEAQALGCGFWLALFSSCDQGPLVLRDRRPFMLLLRAPSLSTSGSPLPWLSAPVVWVVLASPLALGKDLSPSRHRSRELVQRWVCVIHQKPTNHSLRILGHTMLEEAAEGRTTSSPHQIHMLKS